MSQKYCPFNINDSIICSERNCEKCGWNPNVEADRKQKIIDASRKKAQEKETTKINQESVNYQSDVSVESWIALKEQKPENYQQVLIYTNKRTMYIATYIENDELFQPSGSSRKIREVLFWMPAPPLPKM